MLTSPYVAAYMAKLQELGCPWLFGTADPERFLAGHGWRATAVGPGDEDANYDRWPYPVIPRSVPGLPRTYLVRGRKVAGTIAISDAPVAKAQSSTPIRYQLVNEPGIVGSFAVPEGDGPYPAVLALAAPTADCPNTSSTCSCRKGSPALHSGISGWKACRRRSSKSRSSASNAGCAGSPRTRASQRTKGGSADRRVTWRRAARCSSQPRFPSSSDRSRLTRLAMWSGRGSITRPRQAPRARAGVAQTAASLPAMPRRRNAVGFGSGHGSGGNLGPGARQRVGRQRAGIRLSAPRVRYC